MASWIPGPGSPTGPVDWEAYKRKVEYFPESPHQAAIEEPKRRRTAKESETNG